LGAPSGCHAVAGLRSEWAGFSWDAAHHSFPSGHTADIVTSTLFAALLLRNRGRWRVPGLAGALAISRLALAKHYRAMRSPVQSLPWRRAWSCCTTGCCRVSGAPRSARACSGEAAHAVAELAARNTSRYNGRMFWHRLLSRPLLALSLAGVLLLAQWAAGAAWCKPRTACIQPRLRMVPDACAAAGRHAAGGVAVAHGGRRACASGCRPRCPASIARPVYSSRAPPSFLSV